jgi:leader peptidase (prepilin peptidase)/N-methyltransferase
MHGLLTALALSAWASLLSVAADRAEARICSYGRRQVWFSIAACVPIVAFGSLQGQGAYALAAPVVSIALVVGAFSDVRTGYLFDEITLPAAVVTATLAVATGFVTEATAGVTLLVGIFGAVAIFSRGRAIGVGDIKAMYAIGAGFGPAKSILILFTASISGLAMAVLARFGERPESREIRFGPYLAIGSSFALIAGDRIVHGALGL